MVANSLKETKAIWKSEEFYQDPGLSSLTKYGDGFLLILVDNSCQFTSIPKNH